MWKNTFRVQWVKQDQTHKKTNTSSQQPEKPMYNVCKSDLYVIFIQKVVTQVLGQTGLSK